jgi:hypothetical protein
MVGAGAGAACCGWIGRGFRGFPQYGHTFISSVTSLPHLGQNGKVFPLQLVVGLVI